MYVESEQGYYSIGLISLGYDPNQTEKKRALKHHDYEDLGGRAVEDRSLRRAPVLHARKQVVLQIGKTRYGRCGIPRCRKLRNPKFIPAQLQVIVGMGKMEPSRFTLTPSNGILEITDIIRLLSNRARRLFGEDRELDYTLRSFHWDT